MKFKNRYSGKQLDLPVKGRSLYVMSRQSQALWSHGIEKHDDFQGKRYSITLRIVGNRFRRSTIVIGDSNTRHLKFGEGKGTFGFNMPGESVYAPLIEHINPSLCAGYSNIVIQCGVNSQQHQKQ